jgi:short-subunit dehydrogenase
MTKIKDNCILITGGASGIGRIMGRMALEMGARQLIIWDINEENLNATRNELAHLGKVACYKVNIADHAAVEQTFRQTTEECGAVDILINCAGVATSNKTFEQLTLTDIERTMAINATAPMVIALQALPQMIEHNHGHICNIASAAGMLSNPRMSVYAASKWAVVGWSDSVRIELQERGSKVRFTTIAPYYISTGMFDGVRSRFIPILKPEAAARKILRAIEHNKRFKGLPFSFHFIRLCQALLPSSWFDVIVGHWLGIYSTMNHFTGRK